MSFPCKHTGIPTADHRGDISRTDWMIGSTYSTEVVDHVFWHLFNNVQWETTWQMVGKCAFFGCRGGVCESPSWELNGKLQLPLSHPGMAQPKIGNCPSGSFMLKQTWGCSLIQIGYNKYEEICMYVYCIYIYMYINSHIYRTKS